MDNQILATVNGKEITERDLDILLNSIGPQAQQFQGEQGRSRLVDELIAQELFYQDAIENGYENDEQYIRALDEMKNSLLKQYALNKLLGNISVDDDELISYYNENKELFNPGKKATASHILVDSEEKANEIIKEIKEGKPFEEAAREYSSCPSSQQGGSLGEFGPGSMVPEFEDATFKLEVDEISNPVKTQFGYHIIKLNDKKDGIAPEFDEVKNQVNQQYLNVKRQKIYVDKVEELKKKYPVETK
ncbi:peptidylprolyl isomerase [Candidatus Epulonipiscium viviparus]|uniref:peptidylprolyl isomerase n=1 Tax=Candidatus Epulonipiscium viviparus TaxID=420336 RepID=UPI0027380FDD|nr:peptidylprolyl isomerase [Candidatus Epulopiscium viviparus]